MLLQQTTTELHALALVQTWPLSLALQQYDSPLVQVFCCEPFLGQPRSSRSGEAELSEFAAASGDASATGTATALNIKRGMKRREMSWRCIAKAFVKIG